jgi:CSLREA domain-containing protein
MKESLRRVLFVLLSGFACHALAATFTVTKTADTNDGSCDADCSLREAVIAANAAAGADTIVLPAGTYLLTLPDTNENLSANGDLDVTDALTINGAGSATTIIDGNNATRVLNLLGTASLSVSAVTIRNGNVSGFGGGINHEGTGGLTLTNVVITGNDATGFGGGINNNVGGTVSLTGSVVSNNSSGGFGGGINNNLDGTMTLTATSVISNTGTNGGGINNNNVGTLTIADSTIANNTASGSIGGGGILNNHNGTTTITNSTISGNTGAGLGGGGIDNNFGGGVLMINVTISGNTSTGSNGGGGLYNNNSSGVVSMLNVTITGNASTNGGRNVHNNGAGVMPLRNTIIANPASGANCVGPLQSNGDNIASDASCSLTAGGDLPNTNPLLGALANNGGPTQTHALQAGSPAIDAASAPVPAVDQRGTARPQGPAPDIGAFEGSIGAPVPTLSINSVSANEGNAGTTTIGFVVTLSAASTSTVTVDFATANGSATAGSDYSPLSGTLTFAPGVTSQPVNVGVLGDTAPEGNETFVVNLSNAANATIGAAQGTGTIANDDVTGPTAQPDAIPTLSEWMLLLMASLLVMFAWGQLRKR